MRQRHRPHTVAFDVVETLMSLEPLRRRLVDTRREVYQHALDRLGQPPQRVALVAVHAFDCHGARAAGLTTGWAARLERHYAEVFDPAHVTGDDLVAVATALVALPDA